MYLLENESVQHVPWNKGKLIGQKPPLQPKHVWAIRTKLQIDGRVRDLALFNLAIDSKLCGCDVLNLRVEDVAPHEYAIDRAIVCQTKPDRVAKFEIAEHTRQSIDECLSRHRREPGDYLFTARRGKHQPLTTRQYARLVSQWVGWHWLGRAANRCTFPAQNQSNAYLS